MRVAVLGLGFMGSTHVKALATIPEAELAAVCTNDPARIHSGVQGNLGDTSGPLPIGEARVYRDTGALLADPSIDAVDICLPTHLHADVSIAALRSGKHVLVEKPMAVTGPDARAMLEEAARSKRILMVAHVLRFFPAYELLRRTIADRSLGSLRSMVFRRVSGAPTWGDWFADPSRSGGAILDLLIHDVDIALSLFGAPKAISATGYRALERGIDVATADFHYQGGFAVSILGGWYHPKSYPFSMNYTAVFDDGTLDLGPQGVKLHRADGSVEPQTLSDTDAYADEIRYFLACCGEGRKTDRCPPSDSARAVELALSMSEARFRNGEMIEC